MGDRLQDIRLVVFDMDGVLARLDRVRRNQWLARLTGKSPEHFDATIWHSDFEVGAEAGRWPEGADYLAEFNRRSSCSLSREQWIEARRQAMTPIRGMLALARELRRRTPIALLTNNGSLLKESLFELAPEISGLFGGAAHVSCEFQARKPDPQVFERLLALFQVQPAQAVFIDDDPVNVMGARAVGLEALLFVDFPRLRRELSRLGLVQP